MSRILTLVNWNFENNGKKDAQRRFAGHQMLRDLDPDVVLRREMWDAADDGQQVMYAMEGILGLRGWLGEKSCTAIFARSELFAPVRVWSPGPIWVLPPTALTVQFIPAGTTAMPMVLVSYHLNYASATNRLAEVEWLSTWADKKQPGPGGQDMVLPVLKGGDGNSFPVAGTPGDPALPELESIRDLPHRLHRSYVGPDGTRRMDDRPDEALRTAGLIDVARYRAQMGETAAVARTVNASPTHGPDARIDRIYATPQLLPAVTGVDVIEVPLDISDHHIVRVQLDADVLADILNQPYAAAA
ncbi:endonuclease/exonuclease/phosphatase family protein [Streptomyces sp. MAR4 CNY-716]